MSLKKEFFHQNLYFTFTYSIRNRHKIDDLLVTTTLPPKKSYCSYVDAFVIFLTPKCAIFSIYLLIKVNFFVIDIYLNFIESVFIIVLKILRKKKNIKRN